MILDLWELSPKVSGTPIPKRNRGSWRSPFGCIWLTGGSIDFLDAHPIEDAWFITHITHILYYIARDIPYITGVFHITKVIYIYLLLLNGSAVQVGIWQITKNWRNSKWFTKSSPDNSKQFPKWQHVSNLRIITICQKVKLDDHQVGAVFFCRIRKLGSARRMEGQWSSKMLP